MRGGRSRSPEARRAYYVQNKEQILVKRMENYRLNPAKQKAYSKAWYHANLAAAKSYQKGLREKGLDPLTKKQEKIAGRPRPKICEVCGRGPSGKKRIHFDHDHTTGKFRGWLCHKCNVTLGLVEDSSKLLRKLASYLEAS